MASANIMSVADVAFRLGWLLGLSQKHQTCVDFLRAVLDVVCAVTALPPEVYLRRYAGSDGSDGTQYKFLPDMSLSRLQHSRSSITKTLKEAFLLHYKGAGPTSAYKAFRAQCLDLHSVCAAYHNERGGLDRLSTSVEPVWEFVMAKLLEPGLEGAGEPIEEISEGTIRRWTSLDNCKRWIKSLPGERVQFPDPTLPSHFQAPSRRRPSRPTTTRARSATTAPAQAQSRPVPPRGTPVSAAKGSWPPPPTRTGAATRNDAVPPPVEAAEAGDVEEARRLGLAEARMIQVHEEHCREGDDRTADGASRPAEGKNHLHHAERRENHQQEISRKRESREAAVPPAAEGTGKRPRCGGEGDNGDRDGAAGAGGPTTTTTGETGLRHHGPGGDDGKAAGPPPGSDDDDEEAIVDAEIIEPDGDAVTGGDDDGRAAATWATATDDEQGGADGGQMAEPATGASFGDIDATAEVEVPPPPPPAHDEEDLVASDSFYSVGDGEGEGFLTEVEPSAHVPDGGGIVGGGGASGSNIMADLLDVLGRLEGALHHHHPTAAGDAAHGAASLTVHRPSSVESCVLVPGANTVDVLTRLMEAVGAILETRGEAEIVGLTEEVQGRLWEREQSGAVEFDAEERDKASRLLRAMKLWVIQQLETEKARQRVVQLLKDVPSWLQSEKCPEKR